MLMMETARELLQKIGDLAQKTENTENA